MRISDWSSDVCSSDLHQRDDHRPVGPVALDLLDLLQVDLQRPVGDQLDVVQPGDPVALVGIGAVTRRDIDDRRAVLAQRPPHHAAPRSEEHTSELQSLMRISYAVFCLKTKNTCTK